MENVFRVYDPDLKYEVYLLDDWGAAEDGKVSKWVQTLTTTGVGYRTGNFLPVYKSNCDNIAWSRKAVLASIRIELWETNEKDLGYDASGPEVFFAIIQKQKQVNSSAICVLVQTLQKMRLTDESVKDVEDFGNKMAKMAHWISGT